MFFFSLLHIDYVSKKLYKYEIIHTIIMILFHNFFESRNELIQKNDKHKAIATDPAPTSQENKKTKELVLS